ncbi:hypothetical protein DV737_g629, partial [Chaetothyriales sp. CBS 132003]
MGTNPAIDGQRRARTPDPPLASFFRGLQDDRKVNSFTNNLRQIEAPQTPTPLPRRLHRRQNPNLTPIVTRSPSQHGIRYGPAISAAEPLGMVRNSNEDQVSPTPCSQADFNSPHAFATPFNSSQALATPFNSSQAWATPFNSPRAFATPFDSSQAWATPFNSSQALATPFIPGAFGVFYPQTPAFITGGNPVPTPYNGHFPYSPQVPMFNPAQQGAVRSANWRARTHLPSVPRHQMFAQASDFGPPSTPSFRFAGSSNTAPANAHPLPRPSNFTSSSVPGRTQQNGRRSEPVGVRYGQKINFYGYVPSSLHRTSKPTLEQVKASHGFVPQVWKIRTEQRRAMVNWPKLTPVDELEEGKYYAQWAGGYVEINDDLIARCICPADLLQHPCPWDELEGEATEINGFFGGKQELEKYTEYQCPDWEGLNPEKLAEDDENYESRYDTKQEWERRHESKCPHIHGEVEPSCRFIASFRKCTIVLEKAYDCAVGHDLEAARQVSRSRFEAHILDALHAGATRLVPRRCLVLNTPQEHRVHMRMPWGPEPTTAAATSGLGNGFFLHHLPLYSASSLDVAHPERFFIPYLNVGYLEVRKELIERICPADLCGKECPFNNIYYWEEAGDDSPKEPLRVMCKVPVEHPNHAKVCPFIHNVGKTCWYVGRMRKEGVQNCPAVWDVGGSGCQYGHDFEQERMAAFDRLKEHVREAEAWKALPGVVWRNQKGAWMGLDESSMQQ